MIDQYVQLGHMICHLCPRHNSSIHKMTFAIGEQVATAAIPKYFEPKTEHRQQGLQTAIAFQASATQIHVARASRPAQAKSRRHHLKQT